MVFRAALKVLNEATYISFVLQQFYAHVDSLIVIEGADSYMARSTGRVTGTGLSTDGTTEIIQSFPDPRGIIEYVPMGFYQEEDEGIQRMMKGLKAGDVLWTASGDEFFFDADIMRVRDFFMNDNVCLTMTFSFLTYWHDFYHLLRGGGWDNRLARVFRLVEDDMQIISKGATLQDKCGITYNDDYYAGTRYDSDIQDHHFSYVRTAEKIMEKQCWQMECEEGWSSSTQDSSIKNSVAGKLDIWALKKRYRTPQNFVARNFSWFTHNYDARDNIRVEKYSGPWPEALERHEYRGLYWDEEPVIWRGEAAKW